VGLIGRVVIVRRKMEVGMVDSGVEREEGE
jgi:hypothetical protein